VIHHGDCLDVMAAMEPESVDAIVTDPPYGLSFMGKGWDHGVIGAPFAEAMLRVAKPSAYLLAFGGTRTVHRMTVALEDAGWIIRDMLVWAYASGFPKSKASLKPAWEPIVMARKPGPLRDLAIDACRIGWGADKPTQEEWNRAGSSGSVGGNGRIGQLSQGMKDAYAAGKMPVPSGRWPANVILTDPIFDGGIEGVVGGGETTSGSRIGAYAGSASWSGEYGPVDQEIVGDSGTYSRFYSIPRYNETCNRCGAPIAGGTSSDGLTSDTPSGIAPEIASSPVSSSSNAPAPSAATRSVEAGGSTAHQNAALWDDEESASRSEALTTSGTETASSSDVGETTRPDPTSKPRGTSPASASPSSPAKSPDAASLATDTTTTTRSPYLCVTCAVATTSATTGQSLAPVDRGDATRFLIIPKADRTDREPVLGGLPLRRAGSMSGGAETRPEHARTTDTNHPQRANHHPTVKPTELMRHLVRLVTPPGGTVLDPFLGSGTTALAAEMEGFPWVGIEREAEYVAIAEARLNGTQRGLGLDDGSAA
jgi:DNA modification methylase